MFRYFPGVHGEDAGTPGGLWREKHQDMTIDSEIAFMIDLSFWCTHFRVSSVKLA
jgi:hypothetical protein